MLQSSANSTSFFLTTTVTIVLAFLGYIGTYLNNLRLSQRRFFAKNVKHSEKDLQVWRHWMQTVFMPINVSTYELILSKSDLLIEPHMPPCLMQLCGHVASYKVVLEKWGDGDFLNTLHWLISLENSMNIPGSRFNH